MLRTRNPRKVVVSIVSSGSKAIFDNPSESPWGGEATCKSIMPFLVLVRAFQFYSLAIL